jgi:hypothetical protein
MSAPVFGFNDPRYAGFPPIVQIALVSGVCPSHCRHCPMGRKNAGELSPQLAAELRPGFFDFGLFRKVVHEMAQYPWAILRLHSRGEPMAHPQYAEMLGYAKQHGVGTLTSFTNGIYLDEHTEAVLTAPMDMLEVSADAPDAETYLQWRRTDNFDRIHAAVTDLHQARNKRLDSPTRIVVSAVDHPDFRPHRDAFFEQDHRPPLPHLCGAPGRPLRRRAQPGRLPPVRPALGALLDQHVGAGQCLLQRLGRRRAGGRPLRAGQHHQVHLDRGGSRSSTRGHPARAAPELLPEVLRTITEQLG